MKVKLYSLLQKKKKVKKVQKYTHIWHRVQRHMNVGEHQQRGGSLPGTTNILSSPRSLKDLYYKYVWTCWRVSWEVVRSKICRLPAQARWGKVHVIAPSAGHLVLLPLLWIRRCLKWASVLNTVQVEFLQIKLDVPPLSTVLRLRNPSGTSRRKEGRGCKGQAQNCSASFFFPSHVLDSNSSCKESQMLSWGLQDDLMSHGIHTTQWCMLYHLYIWRNGGSERLFYYTQ